MEKRSFRTSDSDSRSNLFSSSSTSKLGLLNKSNPNVNPNDASASGISPEVFNYYKKSRKGTSNRTSDKEEEVKLPFKISDRRKQSDNGRFIRTLLLIPYSQPISKEY